MGVLRSVKCSCLDISGNELAKVYASDSAPSDVFRCHSKFSRCDGSEKIELGIVLGKETCIPVKILQDHSKL